MSLAAHITSVTHTHTHQLGIIDWYWLCMYVCVCICRPWSAIQCSRVEEPPGQKTYTHPHELCVGKEAEEKNDGTFHNRPSLPKIVWSIPTRERDKRVRDIEAFLCIFPFFFFSPPHLYIYIVVLLLFFRRRERMRGGGCISETRIFFSSSSSFVQRRKTCGGCCNGQDSLKKSEEKCQSSGLIRWG